MNSWCMGILFSVNHFCPHCLCPAGSVVFSFSRCENAERQDAVFSTEGTEDVDSIFFVLEVQFLPLTISMLCVVLLFPFGALSAKTVGWSCIRLSVLTSGAVMQTFFRSS